MITFAVAQIGSPYVFGARVQPCTPTYGRRGEKTVNVWHLAWIIPAAALAGWVLCALMVAGAEADRKGTQK